MKSADQDRKILENLDGDIRRSVELIAREFAEGFEAVAQVRQPAVTIFGSARVREGHPAYAAARETARLFAESGWSVITKWPALLSWWSQPSAWACSEKRLNGVGCQSLANT